MRVTVALPTLNTAIGAARCPPTLLLQEARELLLETRQPAAAVDQMLLAAGPGRVRLRVDVEVHGVAGLAPGRPGGELGAVGHHHLDGVVVRMGLVFHGSIVPIAEIWRLYNAIRRSRQAAH